MTFDAEKTYRTDFNDLELGLVTSLPAWGGSVLVPSPQEAVHLFDGDGNTCRGIVERVDHSNGLIYVRPIWDTWTDAPSSTLPTIADALFQAAKSGSEGQRTDNQRARPAVPA